MKVHETVLKNSLSLSLETTKLISDEISVLNNILIEREDREGKDFINKDSKKLKTLEDIFINNTIIYYIEFCITNCQDYDYKFIKQHIKENYKKIMSFGSTDFERYFKKVKDMKKRAYFDVIINNKGIDYKILKVD